MDGRWRAVSRDSKKDVRIILHPTWAIHEVRRGFADNASDDAIDLSPFVTQASHSAFDASVTLKFNRELFGDTQPEPNDVLEIQLWQDGEFKPCWIGLVDAISSFTLQRGERSMAITAKTREQQDIWKTVKRITPMFPQMTDFTYIAYRAAKTTGLMQDEFLLPQSSFSTAHSNTQMADMSAWDMVETVCQPLGWTPFIDVLGRLRVADRGLQHRVPDIVLEDDRLIKVGGQRQRPPITRVRVAWLNPTLKRYKKQDQRLGPPITITLGWFIPYWKKTVWFSDDKTLRAENTRINWDKDKTISVNQFAKQWLHFDFVQEKWKQTGENKGKLSFQNWQAYVALGAFTAMVLAMGSKSDGAAGVIAVPSEGTWLIATGVGGASVEGFITINPLVIKTVPAPRGSIFEAAMMATWATMAMTLGTGTYEIWGTPYDWVHARNISEAFDSSQPFWVDNAVEIENDFIVNEEHAKVVAIRELVYRARENNKWSVTLVDDPRIEFGDILEFTDGSKLYVEDFTRQLERGSEATLDVKGFLIPLNKMVVEGAIRPPTSSPPEPPVPIGPPGTGGGGGGGGESGYGPDTMPDYGDIVDSVEASFNRIVPEDQDEEGKAQMTRAIAWAIYQVDPNIGLFEKTGGNQIMGLSTDVIHQRTDGSFADCCTTKNHSDDASIPIGFCRIDAGWSTHAPDGNTHNTSRWVQPTEALANAPGPMTRV